MTSSTSNRPVPATPSRRAWRLGFHYLEMVAAMFAGMLAFGALRGLAGLTVPFMDRPGLSFTLMATDMALGMGLWMWVRGHGAACTIEMCAAMYAPLVLVPLLWTGLIGAMAFMVLAHVVMMVAMLGVLLRHRAHPRLAGEGGRP